MSMETVSARNPEAIRSMFGSIAGAYDSANDILSLGIHKLWKRILVRRSQAQPGAKILDCATGTGDIAFEFERQLRGGCTVLGTDFCPEMLEIAQKKTATKKSSVKFEVADVTKLPYANASFDVATIGFGIRNTPDPRKTLSEMARVVKPGGRVMVLEFGAPRFAPMKAVFGWYSRNLLPKLGGWISGKPDAYEYLERSSAAFPAAEDFLAMAKESAKFSSARYETFQGGIAYLYTLTV